MARMNRLTVIISLVAALGGFIFGFDTGIIATSFGHATFRRQMYGPKMANPAVQGGIVSGYNAGQAIGGLSAGYLADRFSRKYAIGIACVITIIGALLQSTAVNAGMMIAGRSIAGSGCGQLLTVVPIYLAETAPPDRRGFLVGFQGLMISVGLALANWVGYAGSFAKGDAQWQIPLAAQNAIPVLLCALLPFIPFSPRWLVLKDRPEEARKVLMDLHGTGDDHEFADRELMQISSQISVDRLQGSMKWKTALRLMFSKKYVRRTLTAGLIVSMSQLSGAGVIQNYQNIFYAAVGLTGKRSLLTSGGHGMMGILGQIIYLLVVADRWPRTRTMWTGSLVLASMIGICMALSAAYSKKSNTNEAGAQGAIAAIFIYSMAFGVFFSSMVWVIPSELFPLFLRTKCLAFAVVCKAVVAIVLSQTTPIAMADIGWRFYAFFIATNLAAGVFYFFWLPETGGRSLEEIAALFGDDVLDTGVYPGVTKEDLESSHYEAVEKR